MYLDINNIFRAKVSELDIKYKGVTMPILYDDENELPEGAHIVFNYDTGAVTSEEIGGAGAESLESFLQFIVKMPSSDNGLNYESASISDQFHAQFPRGNYMVDGIKVEWLNVQRPIPVTIDGYRALTVRVNYRIFAC